MRFEQAAGRDADRKDGGLRVLGQRELVVRAFEAERAQRLAERGIGFGKRLAADWKGVGERLAHADLLRALSRKDECNHW